MNLGIIGAGAWGTALGICAARGGVDVLIWSYDGKIADFDGVETPKNIRITREMGDLTGCEAWIMVTPAAFFRKTAQTARKHYKNVPIIICTKGAEPETGCFMSEILRAEIPECSDFGILSGPQFAAEVARGVPTGSTIAGTPTARSGAHNALRELYLTDSDDVIGTEICGIGKNAVALICGYNSVAAAGENERALIFTRAWGEVVKIGTAAGAKLETFFELCGIGDLFLSATSHTSRNFSGGADIARGIAPAGTVEGITALSGLLSCAEKYNVPTPVLQQMREKLNI